MVAPAKLTTNRIRSVLIQTLVQREKALDSLLEAIEQHLMMNPAHTDLTRRLDHGANELGEELTDIDEVLRLLEAR